MSERGTQAVLLQVEGMDCGACERRIAAALGRLDGVGQVSADHATGRVRVRFEPGRTGTQALMARARRRVEAAGFQVTGTEQEVTS